MNHDDPREIPDEQNPAELLMRIIALEQRAMKVEAQMQMLEERDADLEAGIVRMATYQGVLHVLKGQ